MKITKSQLKQIIREEASRLKKQYILEDKKKSIVKELRVLNEGFDSDKFTSGLEPQVAHSKDWNAPLNIMLPSVLRDIELEDWDGIKWYTNKGFEWDSEQNRYKVLFISHQAGPILMYYDPLTRDFHFPEREVISNWYDTLTKESKEGLSQIKDEIQKKVPEFKKELETSEVPLSEELEMSDIDDMSIEDKAVFSAMNDEEVEDDLSDVIAKYTNQGGDYEGGYKDDISVSPGYLSESNKKGKMKITKSQLKEIIKEEASRLKKQYILEDKKKAIVKELRMLNESEAENYYIAVASKDTPEQETKAAVIQDTDEDFEEYEENGWSVQGPMSGEEASIRYDKIRRGNTLNNYLDQFSDDEVYSSEQNWMRDGDDGMNKPAHMGAIDDYHNQNKEADSKIEDIKKRKLRNSKDW